MTNPHGSNNCTANRNVAHHGKAHSQKRGNGHEDGELRPQRHGTLGHIALKHHLVDLRAFKPAVQTIGAARKAEGGHQDERRRRKNRQHYADHSQREEEKTTCRPKSVAKARTTSFYLLNWDALLNLGNLLVHASYLLTVQYD